MNTTNDSEPIHISESAVAKIRDLIDKDGNQNLKLRIYIVGGGCSGFQYGFGFDEHIQEDDVIIKKDSITLLVDALSAQYLMDATVDYKENLQGAQFIVHNPNAQTTCGCGSSFSLKEPDAS